MRAWQKHANVPPRKSVSRRDIFVRGNCPSKADVRCSSLAATHVEQREFAGEQTLA